MRFRFSEFGIITLLFALFVTGCSTSNETAYDCYSLTQFRKSSLPAFQHYIMNASTAGKNRFDVYIQMPFRNIRFEKDGSTFRASYTVSIIFRNKQNEIIQSKEIDRSVELKLYEETISSRVDFFMQTFSYELPAHSIEIIAQDNLSRLVYREKKILQQNLFSDSTFSASSALFLDTIIVQNGTISLRPIMPSSIGQLDYTVSVFQELYNLNIGDSVRISMQYRIPKKNLQDMQQGTYYMSPPYRITLGACMREYDSVAYQHDSVVVATNSGTMQIFQTYPLVFTGGAVLRRSIEKLSTHQNMSAEFSVFKRDAKFKKNLSVEEILFALRFILRPAEFDTIYQLEGKLQAEKIVAFWEERGGKTRKAEFERRIAEANALFTSCVEGCKTPMGIVYIICGAPDFVECRGYNDYWFYNLGERVYSIEFRADRAAHPKYFEITPFSINENLWQYFVERWRRRQ